jgi:quercetin dioxygenase-like cupin family protein
MALPHAQPGQIIDVSPLGPSVASAKSSTLAKTPSLELIRLVLPAGKSIADHKVAGEITIQCLEGEIEFTAMGTAQRLTAGQMLTLPGNEVHALKSLQDATVLVTILVG